MKKYNRTEIFAMAWRFVKRNGFTMSEALATAWRNAKLKINLKGGICRFWFQKVSGEIREAYGTLKEGLVPQTGDGRRPNDTIQVYFDCEKNSWRSFKVANLIRIG